MAYPTNNITTTKTDSVDDVLAQHVNELQGAATDFAMLTVTNDSGGTVVAGDVGYLNEAGDYDETTTEHDDVTWCVVVVGGADAAEIVVATRGASVTVTLDQNCSAGDYLYTSTTAGQATSETYMRPEVFGVALTANGAGAGGTCSALLLCNRIFVPDNNTNDIMRVDSCSDTTFSGTINGAPVGAAVVYTVGAGNENSINPAAAGHLGKFVLHNTTDGDYALISTVNTGTNTITLTANAPAGWANGESIQVNSQTATTGLAWLYFDLEITSGMPALATAVTLQATVTDSGGAGGIAYCHPYETYSGSSNLSQTTQTTSTIKGLFTQKIINNRLCWGVDATGAGTATALWRLVGWTVAVP
jgi:hypothetical protein